jgi:hypothetical protein
VDTAQAIGLIEALATNGADPITGELLPGSSPYNNPQVIRALFQALKALEHIHEGKRRRTLPPNSGRPWTDDEDRLLAEAFDGGVPLVDLAAKHSRTQGAIAARLVKLGRISKRAEAHDRT